MNDVISRQQSSWEQIVEQQIELPAPQIQTYDSHDMPMTTITFGHDKDSASEHEQFNEEINELDCSNTTLEMDIDLKTDETTDANEEQTESNIQLIYPSPQHTF